MPVEIVDCPSCKQKLALQSYVTPQTLVVCANETCGTSLRVMHREPVQVESVPERATYGADHRPESYG
jgi:alpha-aminoadipate carrier protein LysW